SDVLAVGVIQALERHGLRPGTAIAVTGFDDLPLAAEANLTTVRQPIRLKGRLLAQSLLDPEGTEKSTRLEGALVVRGSTASHEHHAPASSSLSPSNSGPSPAASPATSPTESPEQHEWHVSELDLEAYLYRVGFEGTP